jgi:hypothetical protein
MQSTQKLTRALRELLKLIEEEAGRNPNFSSRLEEIVAELPSKEQRKTSKQKNATQSIAAPDIFAALQEKGEEEFRFWLRTLDVATLKTIIKKNGFDPAKASVRWTEPDKFVALIVEQAIARLKRGSAFLPAKTENKDEPHLQ